MDITHYENMVQKALLSVVYEILSDVSENGLEAGKRLYLAFRSDFRSVRMPEFLRKQYPKEMMVALECGAYRNMIVTQSALSVTLSFGGVGEDLYIPFSALTAFADPEERFGLQFEPYAENDPTDDSDDADDESDDGEKIVTFEQLKRR